MMSNTLRALATLIALITGCAAGDPDPPVTLGELCAGFADPYCSRVAHCDPQPTVAYYDCLDAFMSSCCSGASACEQPILGVPDQTWTSCNEGVDFLSCAEVAAGVVPGVCFFP